MFHTLMLAARADRLIKRVISTSSAKLDTVILAKPGDRGLIQNNFGHRRKLDPVQLFGGALGAGIKAARAVEQIAKHIQPHRRAGARRPDINDTTAQRVITRLADCRRPHKTHPHQKLLQCFFVDALPHLRAKSGTLQHVARGQILRGRIQRR